MNKNAGQYDYAINALLDAFAKGICNQDQIATAIFKYLDEELFDPSTSGARAAYLENRKDEIVMDFVKENVKLSDVTWQEIRPTNRTWATPMEDESRDEVLLVNWH